MDSSALRLLEKWAYNWQLKYHCLFKYVVYIGCFHGYLCDNDVVQQEAIDIRVYWYGWLCKWITSFEFRWIVHCFFEIFVSNVLLQLGQLVQD